MNKRLAAFSVIALLGCLFSGCFDLAGEWSYEEYQRVKSPDRAIDAVLVRGNGGATTPFSYAVYIVPSGLEFDPKAGQFDHDRAVFGAVHPEGLELTWRDAAFLEIRYTKAMIVDYKNLSRIENPGRDMALAEIRLVPLDEVSSVPERYKH